MTDPLEAARRHHQAGQLAEAVRQYQARLQVEPDCEEALHGLGMVNHVLERYAEAEALFRRVLSRNPLRVETLANLGLTLKARGRLEEARGCFEQALELEPGLAEVHCNLGNLLEAQGQLDDAVQSFQRALELKPDFVPALLNLSTAWQHLVRLDEAIDCVQRVLRLEPGMAEGWNNLGYLYQLQGRIDEALGAYRKALALAPGFVAAHSNLLFCLQYDPKVSPEALASEHFHWADQHAAPRPAPPHPNSREAYRLLRVGYVSPNFRQHSDASFLEPLLAAHDRERCEIYCYSGVLKPDPVTVRLQGLADHWRSTVGLSDAKLAELIRADGIDILVDTAGHTGGNRLPLFALRPAPVQVSYHGLGTTGLASMDYRLTDDYIDPPQAAGLHRERLVYLPGGFACYSPPRALPPVNGLPCQAHHYITFGSFNNLSKLNSSVIALWSALVRQVPRSRLILKAGVLKDVSMRARVLQAFARQGIPADRIELLAHTRSALEHMSLYHRVDISLDPFPYTGGLTTWESLWMGVPVISLEGRSFISRMTGSLLHHAGLDPLIAASPDQYVALARGLAEDLTTLGQLRSSLRSRVAASPVSDGARLAEAVEAAYDAMWQRYCAE